MSDGVHVVMHALGEHLQSRIWVILLGLDTQLFPLHTINSRVAQWKRAGPITQRSVDRNYALPTFFLEERMEAGKTDLAAPVSAVITTFHFISPISHSILTLGVAVSTITDEISASSSPADEQEEQSLSPGVALRLNGRRDRAAGGQEGREGGGAAAPLFTRALQTRPHSSTFETFPLLRAALVGGV